MIPLQSEENPDVRKIIYYMYILYIIYICIYTHILSLEELGFADDSCLSVLVAP